MVRERKKVRKVYWITHPAYLVSAADDRVRYTPHEMVEQFIKPVLHPVIEKAAKEPDSLVVFVRTRSLHEKDFFVGGGKRMEISRSARYFSQANVRKRAAIENAFGEFIRSKLGNRAIIPELPPLKEKIDPYVGEISDPAFREDVARRAERIISDRGFELERKAHIVGQESGEKLAQNSFQKLSYYKQGEGFLKFLNNTQSLKVTCLLELWKVERLVV